MRLHLSKPIFFVHIVCCFALLFACSTEAPKQKVKNRAVETSQFPKAIGWVNDFEGVFTPDERAQLEVEINALKQRNGSEIAIVTLNQNYTDADHFDQYSLQLAQDWKIGEKEKNNGVLIAFSKNLFTIRIQNGIGLGKIITNEETQQIIDQFFVPAFKQEAYFQGTLNGLRELIKEIEKG